MRLTILGSGTNLHPTRAAAGYLVQTDQIMVLDFGPRTLMNLVKTGVDRHHITHILFSHYHADHFSDFITYLFDEIIFTRFEGGSRPPLTVMGPRGTSRLFHTIFGMLPGFSRPPFRVRYRDVGDRVIRIGATTIRPAGVLHSPGLHCLGYRVEYKSRSLAYSGDSRYCAPLVRLCGDVDVAVLDCSFPASRPNPVHLHAGQCGRVAREAGVSRLVLSHFYPIAERYDVRAEAGEAFGGRITKAKDLMQITI
ncbi:MAG TPA: MBL fold metallo-hydrolase [Nitrospira sp.]|nr:MBL fold metallo-hydrolase [Nitrospira sp.]